MPRIRVLSADEEELSNLSSRTGDVEKQQEDADAVPSNGRGVAF